MEDVDAVYRELGGRIAALRKAKGLTQERLAEQVDLNASYLARIEAGARRATLETLLRIAGALGTRIGDFFAPEGDDGVPRELRASLRGLTHDDILLLAQIAARFAREQRADPARRPRRKT